MVQKTNGDMDFSAIYTTQFGIKSYGKVHCLDHDSIMGHTLTTNGTAIIESEIENMCK